MANHANLLQAETPLLPPIWTDFSDLSSLPRACTRWPIAESHSGGGTGSALTDLQASLKSAAAHGQWQWPTKPVVFISDPHADAEGFLRSLVAAGTIQRNGPNPEGFALTAFGRSSHIVIGGDCLDKGPCNLDMLDALAALFASGADVRLLAGNHDLRLMLAVQALVAPRDPLTDHLFLRMGRKAVPLLAEIWQRFLRHRDLSHLPDEETCRARLFPRADWFDSFPKQAAAHLSAAAITKELTRLRAKITEFDAEIAVFGMTARMIYAAGLECHAQFLTPGGAYAWFYQKMDIIQRSGSVLFVHAGLDDDMCRLLSQGGPSVVNARYAREAASNPFGFYFGPVANLVRTKYRATDKQLTAAGVHLLHQMGIKLIVQGHVNNHAGQRLIAKHGLLHLEGDVTLDRASRLREGLSGIGAGATLIYPSGDIIGLSSDFPQAKHFHPERDGQEHI